MPVSTAIAVSESGLPGRGAKPQGPATRRRGSERSAHSGRYHPGAKALIGAQTGGDATLAPPAGGSRIEAHRAGAGLKVERRRAWSAAYKKTEQAIERLLQDGAADGT